ncbi:Hypothetical predicted protein [Olea europaea subsp. europaea]|uniref:Uncharacterized protein n=1 Tax=Olea europaea subsp. europaea TaxID=158383 RepID=A0A8S0SUV4_OLEEU|nr:Hypothetical predicted protein [Olea europaea subsp. europaea]
MKPCSQANSHLSFRSILKSEIGGEYHSSKATAGSPVASHDCHQVKIQIVDVTACAARLQWWLVKPSKINIHAMIARLRKAFAETTTGKHLLAITILAYNLRKLKQSSSR